MSELMDYFSGTEVLSSEDFVDPGSLEGQLRSLYAERELLAAELDTSDAAELIALVRELRRSVGPVDESLVAQVESLYAERDQLEQQLGVSSAEGIIELVRSLKTTLVIELVHSLKTTLLVKN